MPDCSTIHRIERYKQGSTPTCISGYDIYTFNQTIHSPLNIYGHCLNITSGHGMILSYLATNLWTNYFRHHNSCSVLQNEYVSWTWNSPAENSDIPRNCFIRSILVSCLCPHTSHDKYGCPHYPHRNDRVVIAVFIIHIICMYMNMCIGDQT